MSALEGGYQLGGEYCSAFARSVKAHVASMTFGAHTAVQFSEQEMEREAEIEERLLERLRDLRGAELLKRAQVRAEREAARLAAIVAEEAEAAQQVEVEGEVVVDAATALSTGDLPVAVPVLETAEGSSKKRRRAPVDYAQLDRELSGKPVEAGAGAGTGAGAQSKGGVDG